MPPTAPSMSFQPANSAFAHSTIHHFWPPSQTLTNSTERIPNVAQPPSPPGTTTTSDANTITFSGLPGERVKYFLVMCKVTWVNIGLSKNDLNDAQVASVIYGTRGAAKQFVAGLGDETVSSFARLSDALTRRFPYIKPYGERYDVILREASQLKQGNKTIEEYAAEGKMFCERLQFEYNLSVSVFWIQGLANTPQQIIHDWHKKICNSYNEGSGMTFEEIVMLATSYEHESREQISIGHYIGL